MSWSGRESKQVVEAVVAAFRDSAEITAHRLSRLTARDWQRSYHWLDASGMAIYFLDRVESLHIENHLPAATLERLRGNLADNRQRSSTMLVEFASLNQSFQRAGLVYANLKGFSLSPESCPRPELRCQQDFDFLIDGTQLDLARNILSRTGYELIAATPDVWEFKTGFDELTRMTDHYKARPQRSVELHFASSGPPTHSLLRDSRLERRTRHSWGGVTFPSLTRADQFIATFAVRVHACRGCWSTSTTLPFVTRIGPSGRKYESMRGTTPIYPSPSAWQRCSHSESLAGELRLSWRSGLPHAFRPASNSGPSTTERKRSWQTFPVQSCTCSCRKS
jgi:hypothetical protein